MPPLPRVSTPELAVLCEALARLPQPDRLRAIENAEALGPEVVCGRAYPVEWIGFRLGATAAAAGINGVVRGDRLLADLSALVERLCHASGVGEPTLPEGSLGAHELCARWGVSPKSLARYRRRGLVARRVHGADHHPRLAYTPRAVAAFEGRCGDVLAAAGGFSRISGKEEARMIRRAARYRRVLRCSLNAAALRLARRFGRSHEAVRGLLRRHDAGAASPIFGPPPRPIDRRRELAYRALRRGVEPAEVAARIRRTRATVVRLATDRRAEVLREAGLHAGEAAGEDGAGLRLLSPAPVRTELGAPGHTDLAAFLAEAARPVVPIAAAERTRAAAIGFLLRRAARALALLPAGGATGPVVERVETDLRWAARLKAELLRAQLHLVVRTLEGPITLSTLRSAELLPLIVAALDAASAAIDSFVPERGGRLASPVGLAVNRAATRWAREHRRARAHAARAAPVIRPGVAMPDWTLRLFAWQALVEPDPRVRPSLTRVESRHSDWLAERFGWGGSPPRTLEEMAAARAVAPMHAARAERAALRAALSAARGVA